MIRSPSFRLIITALLLLVGPLTQFQTLYACELMEHDKPGMICCCDELSEMGKMACEMDGSCQDQANIKAGGCCEVSYEPSQKAQASGASSQSQQVLLLNSPQPPPILDWHDFPEIVPVNYSVHFVSLSFYPLLPDNPVYLLTNRFRI